jgi:phage gp46-like protein
MLAPWINSETGDFQLLNGSIEVANYLLTAIYVRLSTPRGKWMYAGSNYGSNFYKLEGNRARLTKEQVRGLCQEALQPLVVTSQIANLNIVCTYVGIGRYMLAVSCTDSYGEQLHFNYKANYYG